MKDNKEKGLTNPPEGDLVIKISGTIAQWAIYKDGLLPEDWKPIPPEYET